MNQYAAVVSVWKTRGYISTLGSMPVPTPASKPGRPSAATGLCSRHDASFVMQEFEAVVITIAFRTFLWCSVYVTYQSFSLLPIQGHLLDLCPCLSTSFHTVLSDSPPNCLRVFLLISCPWDSSPAPSPLILLHCSLISFKRNIHK